MVGAALTAIFPRAGALAADNNLRIASLTMGAYDYLITLPAEYRLYKTSSVRSSGLILFVVLRYSSILVLVVSNVGFFHHGFTEESCHRYYMVTPVLKVIQMMASQAILAIRTYGISQHSPLVGWILIAVYILAVGFQWVSCLYARIPVMIHGNCTIGNAHQSAISTWSFYLVAMCFDCLTLSISTFYLMRVKAVSSRSSWLFKMLLYDGLGYLVVLTFTNLANIILYRGIPGVIQTTGSSFEYAVTWIMSQQILIHPRNAKYGRSVIFPQTPGSRAIIFDSDMARHQTGVQQDGTIGSQDKFRNTDNDGVVQVRVDRSIVVDIKEMSECT